MRLLAKDPDDRPGGAAELIGELGRLREDSSPARSSGEEETTAALGTPPPPILPDPGGQGGHRRSSSLTLAALVALVALLGAVGGALGWNMLQDRGAGGAPEEVREGAGREPQGPQMARVPDVLGMTEQGARERLSEAGFETGVRRRESQENEAGRVLEQSVEAGEEAQEGSRVLLTVGEASETAKVPDLIGLSYPEAENALEQAGLPLGGVKEAPSDAVPAGEIMKQDPSPGTELDTGSYVYLTTSLGPPEENSASAAGQETAATSEAAAVEAAVRGHYGAIGAGSFEEAYSYFGPTFRGQHDQASWISSEETFQIQSSTIHSLWVEEVLGTTATATVDVSFVDNTGTPRFIIVWGLVKEGGQWKLNQQYSSERIG
jgi:hypothetical protein